MTTQPSIATVNEYLFDFSSFFKWCVSYKEILQKNPVIELKIEDPVAPDEKRYPYSQSDIERIFRQLKELQDVNDYKQLERTWTILIAMFSGMRLNEICQLFLDDIVQTDGIPYFKLPGSHPTQRVKNAYSKRAVPIHPAYRQTVLSELEFETRLWFCFHSQIAFSAKKRPA